MPEVGDIVRDVAAPGVDVNGYVNAILNRVKFEVDDSPMDASVPDISHIFEQEDQILDLEINNGHVSNLENIDLQGDVNLVSNDGHTITFDVSVRLAVQYLWDHLAAELDMQRGCTQIISPEHVIPSVNLFHRMEQRCRETDNQVRTSSGEVLHSGEVDTEVDGVGSTVIVSVFLDSLGNFHSQLEGIVLNSQNGEVTNVVVDDADLPIDVVKEITDSITSHYTQGTTERIAAALRVYFDNAVREIDFSQYV
ncbi:unnamed protein product [Timema podura]|uniref:Uncharacterized protein n=1 Tax=Timema podura TaxID=61482 RepID=A0ABN7NGE3_TIMPD|nr:unnamed protein product [Timema podura]